MKNIVKTLASDSWRGAFLKSLALAARGVFLVLVVPGLVDGELTAYVFANSVALIGATILILGLNDELPRVIRGDLVVARSYLRWFYVISALAAALFIAQIFVSSMNLAILIFLLATLSGRLLGGIVRSIDAGVHEQLQNLPWLLFIGAVMVLQLNNALQLISAMAMSLLLVQWGNLAYVLRNKQKEVIQKVIPFTVLLKHGLAHGRSKLFSNLYLLGLTRGPVIIPVWFGMASGLDQIAFAIAVGEVVSQFGSIPANRAYARWCRAAPRTRADWVGAVISSILLSCSLFAVAWIGLIAAQLAGMLPQQASDVSLQVQAMLFFALMPAFRLMRYLLWSRGILSKLIVIIPAAMLMLMVPVMYFLPESIWFTCFAFILLAGLTVLAVASRQYFTEAAR